MPSHYLNQCSNIVNLNLRNKLQWNLKQNSYIFIQENASENIVCRMAAILSRGDELTHWGRDKMAAVFQTTLSNAFSWMKMLYFWLNFTGFPALIQIMAWRRSGDKPLSEPMMGRLPTHICVTRPQWVKGKHQWCSILILSVVLLIIMSAS